MGAVPTEAQLVTAALGRLGTRDAELAVEAARARIGRSRVANPELRIQDISDRTFDEERLELEVAVRWRPPWPGERDALRAIDEGDARRAEAELTERRLLLAAEVRRLCLQLWWASEALKLADARAELLDQIREERDKRVTAGTATTIELAEDALAAERAHLRVDRLHQRKTAASDELSQLTGTLVDHAELEAMAVDTNTLMTKAPELDELSARHEQLVGEWYLANAKAWPRLNFVQLGYHFAADPDDERPDVRVGIEVPLFDIVSSGERDAARAEVARIEAEANATWERIWRNIRVAAAAHETAVERLAAHEERFGQRLERVRSIIAAAKQSPATDRIDVCELEDQLLRLLEERHELVTAVHRTRIELLVATGTADEEPVP